MKKISTALRIKRAMIGLTLGLCLVFTVLAMLMVYVVEDKVFINLLKGEQHQFEQLTAEERRDWQPSNLHMQLYYAEQHLPAKIQAVIEPGQGVYEYFDEGQAGFVLHGRLPAGEGGYWLTFDVSALLVVRSGRADLWLLIGSISLVLLVLSIWLASRLAKQTLAPLQQLTQQLQGEHDDLPQGFAADFSGDEVGVLTRQLERSIAQARQAAEREFEFNRGVSHELRTPIQIAQNAFELLNLNAANSVTNKRQVMDRLQRAIGQMQQITEAFLWLASGNPITEEVSDGRMVFEQLKNNYQATHPDRLIEVDYGVGLEYRAPTAVLKVVLDSLLGNAMHHGQTGTVQCVLQQQKISIENAVASSSTQSGHGLGLVIVKRLCEQLGWELVIQGDSVEHFKVSILVV